MSNHTPGPWKLYHADTQSHAPEHANYLIEFGPGDWGGFWICGHRGIHHDTEEWSDIEADARLIKESPNLLEALEDLVEQVDRSGAIDDHGHDLRNLKAMSDARQLIKRATKGES